jgi:hypothetical protein
MLEVSEHTIIPKTIKYVPSIIKYNEAYSNHINNTQYMQVFTFNPDLIHLFVTTFLTLRSYGPGTLCGRWPRSRESPVCFQRQLF